MTVIILFTFGISLKNWEESGLLTRELKIYKKLYEQENIKFKFITFGDASDHQVKLNCKGFEVIPIYEYFKKSNYNFINIFKSFFYGFKHRTLKIDDKDIIKTNQLWGAWVGIVIKILNKNKLLIRTGYDLLSFKKYQEKNFLKIFLFKCLTFLALVFCDKYIVTSKQDFNFLSKTFPKFINKLLIIPNFVETIKSQDILDRERSLITIGRLESQKNYSYLIKELRNSDWRLDVVGKGSLLLELTNEAKLFNTNTNFLGVLENDKLLKLVGNYQFFISSTLFEGNPKSILEAMSAGCVVIAPNVVGVKEIINNGSNGILYDLKENALKNLLENILDYDLKNISKSAKSYIKENHDFDLILKKELQTYSDL